MQENINADGVIAFCHKKNKNEEEEEEEGNQLAQLFFAALLQNKPLMRFLRKTFNRIKPLKT